MPLQPRLFRSAGIRWHLLWRSPIHGASIEWVSCIRFQVDGAIWALVDDEAAPMSSSYSVALSWSGLLLHYAPGAAARCDLTDSIVTYLNGAGQWLSLPPDERWQRLCSAGRPHLAWPSSVALAAVLRHLAGPDMRILGPHCALLGPPLCLSPPVFIDPPAYTGISCGGPLSLSGGPSVAFTLGVLDREPPVPSAGTQLLRLSENLCLPTMSFSIVCTLPLAHP